MATPIQQLQQSVDELVTAIDLRRVALEQAVTDVEVLAQQISNHWDDMQVRYYGSLADDPTVDPLGDPLQEGSSYWNSTTKMYRIYDGSNWQNAVEGLLDIREYIADEGQSVFEVIYDRISVYVNGLLVPSSDYTASDNLTVVFNSGLPLGTEVTLVGLTEAQYSVLPASLQAAITAAEAAQAGAETAQAGAEEAETNAGLSATSAEEDATDAENHAQAETPFTDKDSVSFDKGAKGWASDAEAAAAAAQSVVIPEATEADFGGLQSFEGQWIFVPDMERRKLEAATGGTCTIDYTTSGQPCYFHVIPKLRWQDLLPGQELGTGVHEAFLRDGVERKELLIGMYQSHLISGEEVSQPRRTPRRSASYDNHRSSAQAGGFDIMSVWEWSVIALWCVANGYQPRGNTNNGQSHSHPHERGIINDSIDNVDTGTGPIGWRHNDHPNGISDLVGNVWEWLRDMKMVDGRILLAPDNQPALDESDWADTGWDMPSASSTNWSGLYDAQNEAPLAVRRALIMPNGAADPDGSLWTNLSGERFAGRGGSRTGGGDAGLGALFLSFERTGAGITRGARLSRLV